MDEYARRCFGKQSAHHFTIAYTPWSNGTVERVMKDIIALFRKMLHNSNKIDYDLWPYLIPHIMSVINGRPQRKLNGLSPRQVFMGISNDNELDVLFNPYEDILTSVVNTSDVAAYYDNLLKSLEVMHKNVKDSREVIRQRNLKAQRFSVPINFGIGDFVLVAIVSRKLRKLHAQWRGPYRIKRAVSPYVYECEDLNANITINVHVRRIKFFACSDMDVSIPLRETILAQDKWATEYEPECVLDSFVETNLDISVKVKWLGFSELESTWEPIESFYDDAPALVDMFLSLNGDKHKALYRYVKSRKLLS
jgi:hypothetical protein